jgi:hypothetical protein
MKKRVLIGVGVVAVAGVLLWPRHARKDAPPDGTVAPPSPEPGASAKQHPRPVMDETRQRQVVALGRVLRALPDAESQRRAEEAPPPEPAPSEVDPTLEQAKQAFKGAYDLYVAQSYAGAAEGFLAAYDLVPYPAFLFNAAVSFEKAQDCPHALAYLERFMEERATAEPDARVEQRLATLRGRCGPR